MKNSNRIILNSIYIYIGVVITTIISLFSVPILLNNLGSSDYGLYSLIAGVITMLSFVKSSMIVTVQRFLNVAFGARDYSKVNKIYSVSVLLYIIVAVATVVLIELLGPFISEGYLNIESNRISTAVILFQVLVISTFFTTIGIPYDALFNVYEDMWLFSIFNTIDSVLRFILAISLGFVVVYDKLEFYAFGLALIGAVVFTVKYVVCKRKYPEVYFVPLNKEDLIIVKNIFSFIGWNLFSTLARLFSTQGFAIVLNLAVGTVINAAYGIANQVNGCLNNFTSSIEKAFNPQIMKSEGMNNRERVVKMAVISTKVCAWIYSLFAIPLLVSLPFVFTVWLKNPPEYTIVFTRIVIVASMVSMLSTGLSSVFYAIGMIRNYLLWLGSLLILVVFLGYIIMKAGVSVEWVIAQFIIMEVALMFVRLFYARKYVGYTISNYIKQVLFPYAKVAIPTFLVIAFIPCNNLLEFILVVFVSATVYFITLYVLGLNKRERIEANIVIKSLKYKIIKK